MADHDLLLDLRALAFARQARGDNKLVLSPDPLSFELSEAPNEFDGNAVQGLVLEPYENAPFEVQSLAKRKYTSRIDAFCDGTRSTYFVGYESDLPIVYTRNASVVRMRDKRTGYHTTLFNIRRHQSMLLAPFAQFQPSICLAYEQLNLYSDRLADLCWTGLEEEGYAPKPSEMETMGNIAWQRRARRRARHLLDLSEQITSITGAQLLREQDQSGHSWLLKDGSFFQFKREYLRKAEPLRNIVSCVKTHPVSFFGIEGERQLRQLQIGERSVAFLPRPTRESQKQYALRETDRQMVSWYVRVRQANKHDANHMSGIVRLDIAAIDDWRDWIDEVSWAVLDEFYGISAMPDPRYDVMPYGIYDCEQALKAHQLPGDLLLAQLR
jgi:hypothetical protein